MDSVYIKAALVQPPTILGVTLAPFSCWHALCLLAFNNPFLGDENSDLPEIGDLIAALLICRDRHMDNLNSFLRFQNRWLFRSAWWMRLLFTRKRTLDLAASEFREYMDAFFQGPEVMSSKGSKFSRVLWPYYVATTLMVNMGAIGEAEAWDMPLSRALCYKAVIAENNGARLGSEEEFEKADAALEEFERQESEAANG